MVDGSCKCMPGYAGAACNFKLVPRLKLGGRFDIDGLGEFPARGGVPALDVPACAAECARNTSCYSFTWVAGLPDTDPNGPLPAKCYTKSAVDVEYEYDNLAITAVPIDPPTCPGGCAHDGDCVGPSVCYCRAGWRGPKCEDFSEWHRGAAGDAGHRVFGLKSVC